MIPQPATGGPPIKSVKGAASVNLDNDTISDLTKSFANAMKPLVKSINDIGASLRKSMAPDPQSKRDVGKDLFKKDGKDKAKDPGLKDMNLGIFGKAALAILAATLLGVEKQLQGIVNAIAFPKIITNLKKPFTALGNGLNFLRTTFSNFIKSLNMQNRGLRKTFGKAGMFDKLLLRLSSFGDDIARIFNNFKGRVTSFAKQGAVAKFFDRIGDFIKRVKSINPSVLRTQAAFGQGGTLGKFFLTMQKFFTRVKKIFDPIGKVLGFMGKILKPVGSLLKMAGSFLKPLLPLLKMFALPITIIMGVIDGIKGFIEGYKDGGFLDGILTAIGSVLGGLIGAPLDLLKSLLAFVLEKLGMKGVADALKEFSFKDIIKNAFGGIANFFANIPSMIEGAVRSIKPGGNKLADFIFGKDKKVQIAQAEQAQAKAAGKLDKVVGGIDKQITGKDKAIAKAQEALDTGMDSKGNPLTEKQMRDKRAALGRLQKQKINLQKKREEKMDQYGTPLREAAITGVALKTEGIDAAKMMAGGAGVQDILSDPKVAKAMEGMTDIEKQNFVQGLEGMQGMDKEQLFAESQRKQKLVAEIRDREFKGDDSDLAKKAFALEAEADQAARMAGVDPDQIGSSEVKMEKGQITEGEFLDKEGAQIGQIQGGSSDNSQNDNSQNTTNNKQEVHYHGGDGGDGFNSSNPSNSLYNSQTTYGM